MINSGIQLKTLIFVEYSKRVQPLQSCRKNIITSILLHLSVIISSLLGRMIHDLPVSNTVIQVGAVSVVQGPGEGVVLRLMGELKKVPKTHA